MRSHAQQPSVMRRMTGRSAQGWIRSLLRACLVHFLSQAQRTHVRPHLADVFQTFGFGARLPCISPSKRQISMGWPDRVLFFMIHHCFIDSLILIFVHFHVLLLNNRASDLGATVSHCHAVLGSTTSWLGAANGFHFDTGAVMATHSGSTSAAIVLIIMVIDTTSLCLARMDVRTPIAPRSGPA
jgi:hypothetical protein